MKKCVACQILITGRFKKTCGDEICVKRQKHLRYKALFNDPQWRVKKTAYQKIYDARRYKRKLVVTHCRLCNKPLTRLGPVQKYCGSPYDKGTCSNIMKHNRALAWYYTHRNSKSPRQPIINLPAYEIQSSVL